MRRKTLLAILLILTLASGSRWLLVQNRPAEEIEVNDFATRFDYALSGFEMRTYAPDGRLSAVLEAPALTQTAISLLGDIREPRLSLPGSGNGSVALRADTATISSDHNIIRFSGAVSLQHGGDPGSLTTVTTASLVYDIAAGTAHTDEQVRLVREGMQLTGTGMDADIHSQQYRLLSKVEGSYDSYGN